MLVKKLFTLVFIRKEDQILLGFKKRGFGMNKWNGFGGKVEANETILEAAARELKEECCLTVKPSDLKNIAHLEFTFEGEPTLMDVRVFSTSIFEGTPKETEEMRPKWFRHEDVPFDDMWLDDKLWFPYMLQVTAHKAPHGIVMRVRTNSTIRSRLKIERRARASLVKTATEFDPPADRDRSAGR